jgi:hypothetical protein
MVREPASNRIIACKPVSSEQFELNRRVRPGEGLERDSGLVRDAGLAKSVHRLLEDSGRDGHRGVLGRHHDEVGRQRRVGGHELVGRGCAMPGSGLDAPLEI